MVWEALVVCYFGWADRWLLGLERPPRGGKGVVGGGGAPADMFKVIPADLVSASFVIQNYAILHRY